MNAAEHLLGQDALARHGARAALVCGERALTYSELARETARAASALGTLGVRPGERVLLLLRDTPEFAAAWLGAVRAGAVAIGLNSKLAETDYRHIVTDSDARLLIADESLQQVLGPLAGELAAARRLVPLGDWLKLAAGAAPQAGVHEAQPEDPAFWLYSSGTTGRPKGIVHTHRSMLPAGQAQREVKGLGPSRPVSRA